MIDPTKHPDHPEQRFLVPGAPTGRFQNGYAEIPELAMRQEPECLDEKDWERHVDREAKQKRAALVAGIERDLRLLTQEERLTEALKVAALKRRDVSRFVLVYRKAQKRGKVDQMERWLQKIEQVAILGRAA